MVPNSAAQPIAAAPPATDVFGYLQRTLPETGFTVTAEDAGQKSMTFTGYGWAGSFTGDERREVIHHFIMGGAHYSISSVGMTERSCCSARLTRLRAAASSSP